MKKSLDNPKRILLVSVNWLGDLIFMTPAIRAVRRAFPDAHIACLVPPRGLELLETNPHLNAVIPFEEARGWRGLLQIGPLARRLRVEKFDAAILFHRSVSRTLAAWLAGVPARVGYATWKRRWLLTHAVLTPARDSISKVGWYLGVVEAAGIPADGLHYEVGLQPADHAAAQKLLAGWNVTAADRVVALHPGANWKLKRWSLTNFARLADALAQRYRARVLFVGGPDDLPLVEQIRRRMKTTPLVATGQTTFRELGALLTKTTLLISNDSGPLHLGLAVKTPVIGLYGPTDPKLTGPAPDSRSAVLFGSIGCPVPCYQLNCPANLCMEQIKVDQVLETAGKFLS